MCQEQFFLVSSLPLSEPQVSQIPFFKTETSYKCFCPFTSCHQINKRKLFHIFIHLGAGKTTLLNYLSGRQISQNLDKKGKILINGVPKEDMQGNFSALSAYVQQDDILFQTMTVRECLEFAAKLKLKGTHQQQI